MDSLEHHHKSFKLWQEFLGLQKTGDKLSKSEDKMWQIIKDYLAANSFITTGVLKRLSSKSSTTVNNYLRKFVVKNLLIKTGDKKSTKYYLK
ncbi:MAG: hypothetical protein FWH31_01905 [Streptococcaceae bacterium]|nr:hypothetical protein [Streptococcaceae bacterium]